MTAYGSMGDGRTRRNSKGMWLGVLGGLVIGFGLGLLAPRIWRSVRRAPQPAEKPEVVAKPNPKPVQVLQIAAQAKQHGLVMSSSLPVTLLKPSQTKRTQQQGRAVFTGFKDWTGTTNYLSNGQGNLLLKGATGTTVTWSKPDYQGLLKGQALRVKIFAGQPYTLFFQRTGRRAVDLGTVRLSQAPASAGATAGPTAAP